jgi:hypothetical protein
MLLQALAFKPFHHNEGMSVVVLNAVDGTDVRMVEQGRSARFPGKSFQGLGITGQVFGDKLQGHMTAELEIFRLIDHAHTTAPQLAEDAVMGYLLTDHKDARRCPALVAVMLG